MFHNNNLKIYQGLSINHMLNLQKCTLWRAAVTSIVSEVLPKEAVERRSIESKPFYPEWGGNLRLSSLIFGKCLETFVFPLEQFWKIF